MTHKLDLQAIRQELQESEAMLLNRLTAARDEPEGLASPEGSSSAGLIEDQRMRNPTFDRLDQELLEKLQAALRRLDDGSFGSCPKCGAEINPERLNSLPYAELCIHCQRKQESFQD